MPSFVCVCVCDKQGEKRGESKWNRGWEEMDDREGDEGGTTPKRNDGGEKIERLRGEKKKRWKRVRTEGDFLKQSPLFFFSFLLIPIYVPVFSAAAWMLYERRMLGMNVKSKLFSLSLLEKRSLQSFSDKWTSLISHTYARAHSHVAVSFSRLFLRAAKKKVLYRFLRSLCPCVYFMLFHVLCPWCTITSMGKCLPSKINLSIFHSITAENARSTSEKKNFKKDEERGARL